MPNRKLVRIGEEPKLPSIAEFFTEMASRQKEEIERLKQEAEAKITKKAGTPRRAAPRKSSGKTVEPYPWLLHPVRKPAAKKSSKSRSVKGTKPKPKATKSRKQVRTTKKAR